MTYAKNIRNMEYSEDGWKAYRALDKGKGLTGHRGRYNDVQNRADKIIESNKITVL